MSTPRFRFVRLSVFSSLVSVLISSQSSAILITSLVPVAGLGTGQPYPAAALAADPALAGFATYDLRVTIEAGAHWNVIDLQSSTTSSGPGGVGAIPGHFYAPPDRAGFHDQDYAQRAAYTTHGAENYLWDTWVNSILSTPDADGNRFASTAGVDVEITR